jgi:hypothetical protein
MSLVAACLIKQEALVCGGHIQVFLSLVAQIFNMLNFLPRMTLRITQQSACVSATVNENKMADMAIDSEEECEEEFLNTAFLLLMRRRCRRLRASHRQTWTRQWIMWRETPWAHANLVRELNAKDPGNIIA